MVEIGDDMKSNQPQAWFDENFVRFIDQRIEEQVESHTSKVKFWLISSVVAIIGAYLIPVVLFAYQFGQFTGDVKAQLDTVANEAPNRYTQREHEVYAQETDRRITETNRRVTRLEAYHGLD